MADKTEDTEMVYEDYDACMTVDPGIAKEDHDFLDESILLLHLLQKNTANSGLWESYLRKYSDHEKKHIILYNWIALSLVREAHSDVAAVAVYTLKDRPTRLYYAKNNLADADKAHAIEFADLVRLAASTAMSLDDFRKNYFLLLQKNCLPKLKRRVDALRSSISLRGRPVKGSDDTLIYNSSQGDELRSLLQSAIDSNAQPPLRRNRADVDALKVIPDTKNIFVALLKIFESLTMYVASEETADMLENLCGHCWIIGMSGTLEEMTKTNLAAHDVILTAAKLGEYFRGTARLFFLLADEKTRLSLSTFQFFAVPPTGNRIVGLCKNWYHVIETIHLRVEGRGIGITREKLFNAARTAFIAYSKHNGMFIRHAELDLIEYLMKHNLAPTVIGISKLSCALCNIWIDMINRGNMMKWKVSGCHGHFYAWARNSNPSPTTVAAEANVKDFVYRQLIESISTFISDPGESPAHPDDLMDEDTGPPTLKIRHRS